MAILKQTTSGGFKPHKHISLIAEDSGIAIIAPENDHVHETQIIPATPDTLDPNTGEVIAPGTPARTIILPGGEDNHVHDEFEDYTPSLEKKKQKDDEVIRECFELYKAACEIEDSCIKNGQEAYRFFGGEQWDPLDKSYLKNLKRACVTINKIEGEVDKLSGYQRSNRTDITFSPIEDGDPLTAEILTKLTKIILSYANYPREESKVFEDQIIVGRGLFNLYVDFNENLQGDIMVEQYPWEAFRAGQHSKEDLSDCEHIHKKAPYALGKLKQLYPEKADKLETDMKNYQLGVYDPKGVLTDPVGDAYNTPDKLQSNNTFNLPQSTGNETLIDIARKEYLVIECWRKIYSQDSVAAVVIDGNPNPEFFSLRGWKEHDISAVKQLSTSDGRVTVYIIKRDVTNFRITKYCGNIVLSDENIADLPVNDFFIVPVYGKLKDGKWWGKVKGSIDPQMELNKRRSQAIDIGDKVVSYGSFYDEDTFPTIQDETHYKNNSTSPGFIQKVNDINRIPVTKEGIKFPGEVVQMAEIANQSIENHFSVTVEPTSPNEPGTTTLSKHKMRMAANEYLFDNLSFAKEKLGTLLVPLIKRYYPPERIMRMLGSEKIDISGKPLSEFTPEEVTIAYQSLSDIDATKYDVKVVETDFSPTSRLATQQMLQEMAASGAEIPPQALVSISQMPQKYKNEFIQSIEAQQAQAAQAAVTTNDTEIEKTLIAKGIIPPAVSERMNLSNATSLPEPGQVVAGGSGGSFPSPKPLSENSGGEKIYTIETTSDGKKKITVKTSGAVVPNEMPSVPMGDEGPMMQAMGGAPVMPGGR